jgi:transcriptional regulator
MYRPSYSVNEKPELALKLIQDFPLGLLISNFNGKVDSNYLPMLAQIEDQELVLTTHLARSNPQWKNLGSEVLVSFQGPNRYISPTMYKVQNNVPTWNYAAVQITGKPEVIVSGSQIKEILNESVAHFESRNGSNWKYNLPAHFQEKLESAIVGLRIRSTSVAKFKLSQNRNDEDYEAVLSYLKSSSTASDQALLDWMIRSPKI